MNICKYKYIFIYFGLIESFFFHILLVLSFYLYNLYSFFIYSYTFLDIS